MMFLLILLSPVITKLHHPRLAQTRKKEKAKTEDRKKTFVL